MRLNYFKELPKALKPMLDMEGIIKDLVAEDIIKYDTLELIKIRVSTINKCAYCLDMHILDAKKNHVNAQKIERVNLYKEYDIYTDEEKKALRWAEVLTLGNHDNEDAYQELFELVGPKGVVAYTLIINQINSWNRLGHAFKPSIGEF